MRLRIVLLFLALFVAFPSVQAQKPMRVALVVPSEAHGGEFWQHFQGMTQEAARQLGIDLTIQVGGRWPSTRASMVERLMSGPNRPDYLVTTVHMGMGTNEIEISEKAKVPIFIVNAGLLTEDLKRVGGPREHFKHWIGQMLPDEEDAGKELGGFLIQAAHARFGAGGLTMLAFEGRKTDLPTIQRNQGLRQCLTGHKEVRLAQLVSANYSPSEAEAKMPFMLKRYPEASILWCANDPMALGAMDALESAGRKAGKDMLFGGIDWDSKALTAIRNRRMTVSMGGHIFDGAWVMVLLYDHYHGIDFAKERVNWRSRMFPVTSGNVEQVDRFFKEKQWSKVDFKTYSKALHPELVRYDFGLEKIFKRQVLPAEK